TTGQVRCGPGAFGDGRRRLSQRLYWFHRCAAVQTRAILTLWRMDGSLRGGAKHPSHSLARHLLGRRGVIQLNRVGEDRMLLAPLAGAALVMSIATGPALEPQ